MFLLPLLYFLMMVTFNLETGKAVEYLDGLLAGEVAHPPGPAGNPAGAGGG